MRKSICIYFIFFTLNPAYSVTTKMFRVLDTCARYRLGEISVSATIEKLKLNRSKENMIELKEMIGNYCSVFTPNEKIEF